MSNNPTYYYTAIGALIKIRKHLEVKIKFSTKNTIEIAPQKPFESELKT
jgi:hypothetical protein